MNVERMRTLADALETAETFDHARDWTARLSKEKIAESRMRWFGMDVWRCAVEVGGKCGTVGCVAGWACGLFSDDGERNVGKTFAGEVLGLDLEQSRELFMPVGIGYYRNVSGREAAEAVRNAADGLPKERWWEHLRSRSESDKWRAA